jgi:hypothetical protein
MGLLTSAECGGCGLEAARLCLDIGMSPAFNFVSNALAYCPTCERLTAEPRFLRPETLRRRAQHTGSWTLTAADIAELAAALATALERTCRKCHTKQRDVRYVEGSEKPHRCPRCSRTKLRLQPVGIWD